MGHALNKVLKDIINRYHMLRGRRVRFVPGWDCHGLPIELKVLQSMPTAQRAELTPVALRREAKAFALSTVEAQKESFQRYGVWADWDTPYLTLSPSYEAAQVGVFGAMFLKGHIYRGLKPVNWSPSSRTALAEAELEYPEGHTSRSVYVAMPLLSVPQDMPSPLKSALQDASLAIWTTTPWTLPANAAVAVNERLTYAVVAVDEGRDGLSAGRKLVVAKDLIATLEKKLNVSLSLLAEAPGAQLVGCTYSHPLSSLGGSLAARVSPVVVGGDYITTEAGTGLVHTAPGHGQEDYLTGMRCGLPLLSPVDDAGRFTEDAGPGLEGLPVLKEGTAACIAALGDSRSLLLEESYGHKYPYDWRTKQPTIFRATEQWFASVERFRDAALEAVAQVTWVPAVGQKRITPMVSGRSDWCISRQRSWGVPIPVFYDLHSGKPLIDGETLEHIQALFAAEGSDAWWTREVSELLPEKHRHLAPSLRKGTDTMDVWFDSGSSWAGVLAARADEGLTWPADLYLEGSDQHRGWFQSSLLTSVAARGGAPYKTVLTHGFVLDERGLKMSKSLGNVLDPKRIIDGGKDTKAEPAYGADVLRLWVASVDYTSDVLIGAGILRQMGETYRKLRGTLRYLLGNLHDYEPAVHAVGWEALPAVDRYVLRRLGALSKELRESYDAYAFARAFAALNAFTVTFLSNFYLDTAKDRLYVRRADAPSRRACQTVLAATLRHMTAALAPLTPHTAEDAYRSTPFADLATAPSVFQAGWPSPDPAWLAPDAAEAALWDVLLSIRAEVNKVIEAARTDKLLGAGLEARVRVHIHEADGVRDALRTRFSDVPGATDGVDELRYLLLVSSVEICDSGELLDQMPFQGTAPLPGGGTLRVGVAKAEGAKCERCWNFSALVGRTGRHPTLCERCVPVADHLKLPSQTELKAAAAAEGVTVPAV